MGCQRGVRKGERVGLFVFFFFSPGQWAPGCGLCALLRAGASALLPKPAAAPLPAGGCPGKSCRRPPCPAPSPGAWPPPPPPARPRARRLLPRQPRSAAPRPAGLPLPRNRRLERPRVASARPSSPARGTRGQRGPAVSPPAPLEGAEEPPRSRGGRAALGDGAVRAAGLTPWKAIKRCQQMRLRQQPHTHAGTSTHASPFLVCTGTSGERSAGCSGERKVKA